MITELQVGVRRYPTGGPARDDVLTVSTPAQVEGLLTLLGRNDADDAYATHLGRPTKLDELEGEDVPDHVLYLAVRGEWGYLRYLGARRGHRRPDAYHPIGDRRSPVTHGTNNIDYPAGSGLPLATIRSVVVDFLNTGELPSGAVRWRSESRGVARAS